MTSLYSIPCSCFQTILHSWRSVGKESVFSTANIHLCRLHFVKTVVGADNEEAVITDVLEYFQQLGTQPSRSTAEQIVQWKVFLHFFRSVLTEYQPVLAKYMSAPQIAQLDEVLGNSASVHSALTTVRNSPAAKEKLADPNSFSSIRLLVTACGSDILKALLAQCVEPAVVSTVFPPAVPLSTEVEFVEPVPSQHGQETVAKSTPTKAKRTDSSVEFSPLLRGNTKVKVWTTTHTLGDPSQKLLETVRYCIRPNSVGLFISNLPWGCLTDVPHDVRVTEEGLKEYFGVCSHWLRRGGYVLILPGPDPKHTELIVDVALSAGFTLIDEHLVSCSSKSC